jgi:tripartite-type tricarboxylate transporter receptor subunit TctC
MSKQRILFGIIMKKILLTLLLSFVTATQAADVVKIIVPFSTGGAADLLARQLQKDLNGVINKTFVVENKPGATGDIGAAYVANQRETTLMISGPSLIASLVGRDPTTFSEAQIVPLVYVGYVPFVLVTSHRSGLKTFQDIQRTGADRVINFGSSGTMSGTHIAGEIFKASVNKNFVHIPYKGAGQTFPDLIAGNLDALFIHYNAVLPLIAGQRVNPIAVETEQRHPQLPDVPTFQELGISNVGHMGWLAVFVNSNGDPAEQVQIRDALIKILKDKNTSAAYQAMGWEISRNLIPAKNFFEAEKSKMRRVTKSITFTD